jgi:hypothetical protein
VFYDNGTRRDEYKNCIRLVVVDGLYFSVTIHISQQDVSDRDLNIVMYCEVCTVALRTFIHSYS